MPISPATMLAMSMQAQPGLYAVLLGSGVSHSAGIKTGWEVVKDLVHRIATTDPAKDETSIALAASSPEEWWARYGDGELGYSKLLGAVAGTGHARQGLLSSYFEPEVGDDGEVSAISPSRAHHAIAQLVLRGSVKVIVTTNFDRLMESALEAIGIAPRVISTLEQVRGRTPLTHAKVTVIKVHGDYLDASTLNTAQELEKYPKEWKALLREVFDDYGLIVSGWSAKWDKALRRQLEQATHRYQLFWDKLSSPGVEAKRLIATRAGSVIEGPGADELFETLVADLEALDKLAAPALTTDVAVTRLKRYLLDPTRRIDLHDLVMGMSEALEQWIAAQDVNPHEAFTADSYRQRVDEYADRARPLLSLVTIGAWHGDSSHADLWQDVLQRLVEASSPLGLRSFDDHAARLRRVPAALLLSALGITAAAQGRESLFIAAGRSVQGTPIDEPSTRLRALELLLNYQVFCEAMLPSPRPGRDWPASRLVHDLLRPVFATLIPYDDAYDRAFDGNEYRRDLLLLSDYPNGPGAFGGLYTTRKRWPLATGQSGAEAEFLSASGERSDWPWDTVLANGEPGAGISFLVDIVRPEVARIRASDGR